MIAAFVPAIAYPANATGGSVYSTNENVLVGFDAGLQPEFLVFVNNSANFTTVATLSGYMIDIP